MCYVHKCAQASGSMRGCVVYQSVHTVRKGVCRCVYTQRCAGVRVHTTAIQMCADAVSTLHLVSSIAHVVTSESRWGRYREMSHQLRVLRGLAGDLWSPPGNLQPFLISVSWALTPFSGSQSPGCMQASTHADKINFPIFTCYLFTQPQIHPLYLLPCLVCAGLTGDLVQNLQPRTAGG